MILICSLLWELPVEDNLKGFETEDMTLALTVNEKVRGWMKGMTSGIKNKARWRNRTSSNFRIKIGGSLRWLSGLVRIVG